MPFVLCTGVNDRLVYTRKLLLEAAGHTVTTALSEAEIVAACKRAQFDVAIIGQCCDRELKRHYLDLIRKYCRSAKVLEIYMPNQTSALKDADDWLESPAIPSELADRVGKLARPKKGVAGGG